MQNKNEGNENKVIIGDLNCTMDKIDRDGENKAQRLYRCCSNYALSKLIVDNGLEDLWRRENPDSSEFTTDVYTDTKTANNTKINHIMVSFTDHYNAISIDRLPSIEKLQLEKIHDTLIILFYVSPRPPELQRLLLKTQKKQVQLQHLTFQVAD